MPLIGPANDYRLCLLIRGKQRPAQYPLQSLTCHWQRPLRFSVAPVLLLILYIELLHPRGRDSHPPVLRTCWKGFHSREHATTNQRVPTRSARCVPPSLSLFRRDSAHKRRGSV